MSVGVENLDTDHKQLVSMVNELYDGILAGDGRETLGRLLDRLVDYTQYHFAREEELFAEIQYDCAEEHRQEHASMAAWMMEMRTNYRNGTAIAPSLEVMNYLKDWLFDHVISSDQKFVSHLKAVGTR